MATSAFYPKPAVLQSRPLQKRYKFFNPFITCTNSLASASRVSRWTLLDTLPGGSQRRWSVGSMIVRIHAGNLPRMVARLHDGLRACVEENATGQPRLTVTLPDRASLDQLAQTLARLLAVGGQSSQSSSDSVATRMAPRGYQALKH
jgi:hypothetical protein